MYWTDSPVTTEKLSAVVGKGVSAQTKPCDVTEGSQVGALIVPDNVATTKLKESVILFAALVVNVGIVEQGVSTIIGSSSFSQENRDIDISAIREHFNECHQLV